MISFTFSTPAFIQDFAGDSALQAQLNRQFSDEPAGSGVLVETLQHDNTRTIRSSPSSPAAPTS